MGCLRVHVHNQCINDDDDDNENACANLNLSQIV